MWKATPVQYQTGLIINWYKTSHLHCVVTLFAEFSFRSLLTSYWSCLRPLTSQPDASGGGVIDRPVLCLCWIIPLPPLLLPRWQMGFLRWNTQFPFLSPQIGVWARVSGGGRDLVPQFLRQMTAAQANTVHSESFTVTLPHTQLNTNLAHYSLYGVLADLKSRPVPVRACLWFTMIIFLYSPLQDT